MRICILHQAMLADAAPDEQDVLHQVEVVGQSLMRLGHRVEVHACTLNLESLDAALNTIEADLVFNLVESVSGSGRLIYLPPALLDARRRPYTGNTSEVLFVTSHKILAKERMREAGLPTPLWMTLNSSSDRRIHQPATKKRHATWIIKSIWEHASQGMDDTCIVHKATPDEVANHLDTFADRMGGECFAEEYIEGREFNLALLAGPNGPEALPPAEIVFTDFPDGKPRIVGYQAKWATDSFEYKHTTRRCDFDAADQPLLEGMKRLALQCWQQFGLAGYARVDFRVDSKGKPWILEVNTNPCLSPDAGFAAAVKQAGLTYDQAIARILADALTRASRFRQPSAMPRPMAPTHLPAVDGKNSAAAKSKKPASPFTFRYECNEGDIERIRELTRATGFFHAEEVEIAVELVDERLKKGPSSGYEFVFAEQAGHVVGYTCFGPIPCTATSFDLYWIAVHPSTQGQGLGRLLNEETENRIRSMDGTRVYAETSSRPQYLSTRAFYERTGYKLAEMLEDFYAPGDGRATFLKVL